MNNKDNRYISPDGTPNMNSIANLTGTFTAPLVERIWEQSGHNETAVYFFFEMLERMHNSGHELDCMNTIKMVYGVFGHEFADEIETASQNVQVRNGFIISFLSDYDDALLDLSD